MKHTSIKIIALSAVALIGWNIGGMIPAHTITMFGGFIFGAFVGIPAMLILATSGKRVRHDHYHHAPTETPTQPQKQPLRLPARPTRYTVVASRPALPTVAQSKLEVN